jgi:OOP family OmpA-OmpF porin
MPIVMANSQPSDQQLDYRWGLIDYLNEEDNGVQVVEVGDTLKIILSVDHFFKFPTDTRVIPTEIPTLEDIASLVMTYGNKPITVSGHTDNVGSAESKLERSKGQAETIVGFLWSGGIHLENLTSVGCADTKPVSRNTTADGSAANRRVEIDVEYGRKQPRYYK